MKYRWDDIRLFLAIERHRTLAGAGADLGWDGSTVSRRLASFEESLARTLFDRTREGMQLTALGEQLLPFAEEIARNVLRFDHAAESMESEVAGVVKITTPPSAAETFVVPILPRLFARHPKLRVDIDASSRYVDLARGEADIALGDRRESGGDLVVTRLLVLDFAVLASPALAQEIGVAEDWSRLRWLDWNESLMHLPTSQWLRETVPGYAPVMRSNSMAAQIAAVQTGLGVALLPRANVFVYDGLVELPLSETLTPSTLAWPTDEMWMASARSRRHIPRVAALWDFLLEEASSLVSPGEGFGAVPGLHRSRRS